MQIPTGFQWPTSPRGHPHFWQRGLSRRQFIGASAAATAGALTAPAWLPSLAQADANDPTPIPQSIGPFHIQLPGQGEPSTITDFQGVVGVAAVGGMGTATNVITGGSERLNFDADNRFMMGTYVAGGHTYHATFAFV
jgi:hypothetical protein